MSDQNEDLLLSHDEDQPTSAWWWPSSLLPFGLSRNTYETLSLGTRSNPKRSQATSAARTDSARRQHDEVLPAERPAGLLDRAAVAEAAEVDHSEAQLIEKYPDCPLGVGVVA